MNIVWWWNSRHSDKIFILIVCKTQTLTGGRLHYPYLMIKETEVPSREFQPLNIPAHMFLSQHLSALIFLTLLNQEVTFGENMFIEWLTHVGMFLSHVFLANLSHRVYSFPTCITLFPHALRGQINGTSSVGSEQPLTQHCSPCWFSWIGSYGDILSGTLAICFPILSGDDLLCTTVPFPRGLYGPHLRVEGVWSLTVGSSVPHTVLHCASMEFFHLSDQTHSWEVVSHAVTSLLLLCFFFFGQNSYGRKNIKPDCHYTWCWNLRFSAYI